MDQSGPYPHHPRQQHLFQQGQLPPPASLLPMPSFRSNNTLPPINSDSRFPPPSYHPSLATPSSGSLSSPSSSHPPWPPHRTPNSREDTGQNRRRDSKPKIEPDTIHHDRVLQQSTPSSSTAHLQSTDSKDLDDGFSSTSDFVKKLYKMLEDASFQNVVAWTSNGEAFVVKDMNEFTKSILPRMFKHSNFASFVRQLNKYDFHKVKNTDENQYGDHSWTFRHPDFQAGSREALENIKRKVPAQRKSTANTRGTHGGSPGASPSESSESAQVIQNLQTAIERLTQTSEETNARLQLLERKYQNVLNEMLTFQQSMAQQDGLMQNLIQYFLQLENAKLKEVQNNANNANGNSRYGSSTNANGNTNADSNPFVAAREAQRIVGQYAEDDVARASLEQLNEISRRATAAGMVFSNNGTAPGRTATPGGSRIGLANLIHHNGPGGQGQQQQGQGQGSSSQVNGHSRSNSTSAVPTLSREESLQRIEELARIRPASAGRNPNGTTPLPPPASYANGSDPFIMPGSDTGLEPYGAASANGGLGVPGVAGMTNAMMAAPSITHSGLQVFTLGHLMPKSAGDDDATAIWQIDPSRLVGMGMGGLVQDAGAEQQQEQDSPTQRHATAATTNGYRMGGNAGAYGGEPGSSSAYISQPSDPSSSGIASTSSNAASTSSSLALATTSASTSSIPKSQKLRVRRSTFVPGWAVPPRVLLVDDDAVSRKLSSKFLQVFGCTIDVAVDGVVAVNKMNFEKYDLVLMDIVMPKLDGVTATSLIRQFDHMTPIISMTSNSKPNEILTYYNHGMNDILPKPFTKEGLLSMLEKHLTHLKAIQQMTRDVPRSVGLPPLSDSHLQEAIAYHAANPSQPDSDDEEDTVPASNNPPNSSPVIDGNRVNSASGPLTVASASALIASTGKINPLTCMGLTDEAYHAMLQSMVADGIEVANGAGAGGQGGAGYPAGAPGGLFVGTTTVNIGMGMGIGVAMGEKRGLDEVGDAREGKRSRFEVIE